MELKNIKIGDRFILSYYYPGLSAFEIDDVVMVVDIDYSRTYCELRCLPINRKWEYNPRGLYMTDWRERLVPFTLPTGLKRRAVKLLNIVVK